MGVGVGGRRTRRDWLWFISEMVAWGGGAVFWIWKLPSLGALAVIATLFWAYRFAGALALFRVDEITFTRPNRLHTVAGWFFASRPFASGVAFSAGTIAVMVDRPHKTVIVIGLLALLPWLASVVVGVRLLRGWRQRLREG